MQTPPNLVYVKLPSDTIREKNGFSIDTSYAPMHYARQYGEIALTNPLLKGVGLDVGVQLMFHHFVALEGDTKSNHKTNYNQFISDKVGERCHPCSVSDIFAFYDKTEMCWRGINGWVLGHPILNEQTQNDIISIVGQEKKSTDYVVRVISKNPVCKVNDVVYLTKDCDYEIQMPDGNRAWAFNVNDIMATKLNLQTHGA